MENIKGLIGNTPIIKINYDGTATQWDSYKDVNLSNISVVFMKEEEWLCKKLQQIVAVFSFAYLLFKFVMLY